MREQIEQRRAGIVAGHDRLRISRLDAHRNAAVEIGEQDHPRGVIAGEEDAPDHAARIDHRLAGLDALRLAGVEDHGLQERLVGTADDARHHRGQRGIGHGVQQELVALDAIVEHDGGVAPLAQAGILVLQAKIFPVDA